MKITSVDIYDVKLDSTPSTQWNPVVLRINTDEGIYGLGEVALAYGVGAPAGLGMVKHLAERFLIGADPFRIEYLWDLMYRKTFWAQGGGPVVYGGMSAIDEALWDIKGKALGVPVYELLGGRVWDKLRVYANGWYHGMVSPEDYAEGARKVVADGYTAMKFDPFAITPDGKWDYPLRALTSERADLAYARVEAVREAIGPDIDILVEVHGNLGTTSAIQIGKRLEALKPFFYEEPVDALNVDCMKKVADNVDIPIAAGERLYTRYGFRQYIEEQILDILQPDVGLTGGIMETKKIATYAETYGIHVQPHNCAGPISTAVSVQVDACITNFIIQEWFPYHHDERYHLVTEPLEPQARDGYYEIPNKPGLGVELNEDVIARYSCLHIE
ncbi:MAG: galactonate dehydratase [Anaerolineae bacterium]|nr:galactonate dehydratase [Anaerolineae bacterium]